MKTFAFLIALFISFSSYGLVIHQEENHLYIKGDIVSTSSELFSVNLSKVILDLTLQGDFESPVYLHLDIPNGGLGYFAFNIADNIKTAQDLGTKVITIVESGKLCTSGCTFIWLAGGERYLAADAKLAFHGFTYNSEEVSEDTVNTLKERYYRLLRRTHPQLEPLFREGRIIEDNVWVGFTGRKLYDYKPLEGLVTGLYQP